MKLTEKDKTFLENLKKLMESKNLWVEFKPGRPSYMVLKGLGLTKIASVTSLLGQVRNYPTCDMSIEPDFKTLLQIASTHVGQSEKLCFPQYANLNIAW